MTCSCKWAGTATATASAPHSARRSIRPTPWIRLAQRFVNAINTLFVGISAARTGIGPDSQSLTLSPVAGFTLVSNYAAGTGANGANPSTGSITASSDIKAGNEGVWQVDASQSQPLNQAFVDYLTDFCAQVQAAGPTMTVSFSQELLAPPDVNTSSGAWAQTVREWQPGPHGHRLRKLGRRIFVEAVQQVLNHDPADRPRLRHREYSSHFKFYAIRRLGNRCNGRQSFQLTTLISGGYTPGVGDATFIDLEATRCTFNPSTVSAVNLAAAMLPQGGGES